jgi:putative oxidoreductase
MASSIDRKLAAYNDIALLIGRILIGLLFVMAAYGKFKGLAGTTGYMTKLGVPGPAIMAPIVAAFELLVGVLVIVGFKTRLAALAIAIFVVIAALIAHTNFGDGNQLNHFLKNLAVAGGCLALFVSGAGAYSVDARRP